MSDIRIGNSQVYTSSLGLGANAVGGHNLFPGLDDEIGKEIVRTALRNGTTLLDTAYVYGLGRSEELIGEVLKESEFSRNKVVIATKGSQIPGNEKENDNSPEFLKNAVEDSLKRLQTDYIDIFYIHFPDNKTPKNEAVRALQELKKEGKIRAIGISNFSLDQIKESNIEGFVDIVEDQYSLLHREAEQELFPYLKKHNISFVPYFPLASGLLTGKYLKQTTFKKEDIRSNNPDFQGKYFKKTIAKVEQLKKIAHRTEATVAQLVLAWYIKNPAITVVIPGAKSPEQVESNTKATDIHISNEDYQIIDELFQGSF